MPQDSRTFLASMEAFPCAAAFVEEACAAAAVGPQDVLRVRLIVEELFTNTVSHGHGAAGGGGQIVILSITVRDGEVALIYEDTAPPYNPFAAVHKPDDSAAVEEWPVGGLGVLLIAHIASRVEYTYAEGRNRTSLVVATTR